MGYSRECLYCSKRFTAKMERKLFCCDACRARFNRETKYTCFYCGKLGDSIEHVTPQSVFKHGNKETVNCCRECNSMLGAAAPYDLEERCVILIERTRKKYKLDLPVPEWDDEELNELGKSLKEMVQAKIYARQRAIERVLFMVGTYKALMRG